MNRGDVVMVDWLYSDRTGSKLRPAVVVQADFLNSHIDDTVLIPVMRSARALGSTEVLIDPAVENISGLRFISVASCNNFLTVDQTIVVRTIGQLSPTTMLKLDACIRIALHLT